MFQELAASHFLRISYLRALHRFFPWYFATFHPAADCPEVPLPEGFGCECQGNTKARRDKRRQCEFQFECRRNKRVWRRRFPELFVDDIAYFAKLNKSKRAKWAYDDPLPGEHESVLWHGERALMSYVFKLKCDWRDKKRAAVSTMIVRKAARRCRKDKKLMLPPSRDDEQWSPSPSFVWSFFSQ